MRFLLLAVFGLVTFTMPAFASRTVTSPTVSEGSTVAEVKGEYIVDDDKDVDGAWKNKVTLSHGFTSYWSSEIETNIEHSGDRDDDAELNSIDWKNKFQLTSQQDDGIDTGLRVTYSKDLSGGEDSAELKLLAGKDIGVTSHRINVIFDRSLESGKGVDWGLSWSSRYKLSDQFEPGFEVYNSFGRLGDEDDRDDQDHRAGPVFYGKLNDKLSYDAGYLVGLNDGAPDGTAKVILKYKLD